MACAVACKTGHELSEGICYTHVSELVRGQMPKLVGLFLHHRCFHCEQAACVQVCPTGALAKWNGLTVVDAAKCSACGYCTDACPFKVPNIADDHVAKCVGCLDLVQDGQTLWCAQTCPSQAIRFGARDQIVADAKARLATLLPRYPNARLYGETELGGLGAIMLLLDQPAVYGLPENPQIPATLNAWQNVVQPAAAGLSLTALVVTGLSFIIARRRHVREKVLAPAHQAADAASKEEKPDD